MGYVYGHTAKLQYTVNVTIGVTWKGKEGDTCPQNISIFIKMYYHCYRQKLTNVQTGAK